MSFQIFRACFEIISEVTELYACLSPVDYIFGFVECMQIILVFLKRYEKFVRKVNKLWPYSTNSTEQSLIMEDMLFTYFRSFELKTHSFSRI